MLFNFIYFYTATTNLKRFRYKQCPTFNGNILDKLFTVETLKVSNYLKLFGNMLNMKDTLYLF